MVYYLTATDNDGLHSSAPNGAPGSTFAYLVGYATPGVVLNEIMALNTHTLEDPNEPGEFPDWIELHNPAGTPASLDGLYLSNDPAQPFKFPIPAGITVPPMASSSSTPTTSRGRASSTPTSSSAAMGILWDCMAWPC